MVTSFIGTSLDGFFFPKKNASKADCCAETLEGIVNIVARNPGGFECMERCIWLAFFESSGAKAYANTAVKTHRIKKQQLKTPQKFRLNFWSAIPVNEVAFFTA